MKKKKFTQGGFLRFLSLVMASMLVFVMIVACGEEANTTDTSEVGTVETDTPVVEVEPTVDLVEPTEMTDTLTMTDTVDPVAAIETMSFTSLERIVDDPGALIGSKVNVRGDVNVVVNDTTLSIADNTLLDLNEILVVGISSSDFPLTEDLDDAETPVVVQGTVQLFTSAEIDAEWGLNETEIEIEDYEQRPIIVADSIQLDYTAISLEQVLEDPAVYEGNTVTLNGRVDEALTANSFTMADNTFLDLNEILVVTPNMETSAETLDGMQPVRVQGTLQLVNADMLEDLGDIDLDENFLSTYDGKPIIIADQVWVATPVETEAEELQGELANWYGRQVAVAGEVSQIENDRIFSLSTVMSPDDQQILVIGVNEQVGVVANEENAEVKVIGTVRRFDVEALENDLGLTIDPALEAEYTDAPVIVATSIQRTELIDSGDMNDTDTMTNTDTMTDTTSMTFNSLEEVVNDPAAFVGQQVAVRGNVNVVVNESTLSIADNTLLDLNEILVVNVPTDTLELSEDLEDAETPVIVEGTVQLFTSAEIDAEWGLNERNIEIEDYEQRPIIVADSVQLDRSAISLEQLLEDPAVYAGKTVNLTGRVDEALTADSFTMADNTFFDTNELLIVTPEMQTSAEVLYNQQPVRVEGTLELVNADLLEERLGDMNLDENFLSTYEGKPILIADQVWVSGSTAVELDEITENPVNWYGRQVTVAGEVNVFKSEQYFSIATIPAIDENELVVIVANDQVGATGLEDGSEVQVTGTIRRLNITDVERDFSIDLDPELEVEYENKPVLIATSVQVVE